MANDKIINIKEKRQNKIRKIIATISQKKKKCDEGIGLASFSYADYILLSSVIAYSIAEELDDDDLSMFIIFLNLLLTDLGLIVSKRGIRARNSAEVSEAVEEDTIEGIESVEEDILF